MDEIRFRVVCPGKDFSHTVPTEERAREMLASWSAPTVEPCPSPHHIERDTLVGGVWVPERFA